MKVRTAGVAAFALVGLYLVVRVHAAGEALLALTLLVIVAGALWAYGSARTHAVRYLYPGIAAAIVFVVFPMLYTVAIGFTNTSSTHLLEREAATRRLLEERVLAEGSPRSFSLEPTADGRVRLRLPSPDGGAAWLTPALRLDEHAPQRQEVALAEEPAALPAAGRDPAVARPADPANLTHPAVPGPGADAVSMHERVRLLPALRELVLRAPDGSRLELVSLREFAPVRALYEPLADGVLRDRLTGVAYRPDERSGFFTAEDGQRLLPGFRVAVGFAHYARLFGEAAFREPFVGVFAWTVAFAALSVAAAAALGLLLAVLLHWDALRGRGAYRIVLFLPYAVPGFISILVFKGLFNQNLGEVNVVLHGLFGIRPAWFSDPWLARAMLLVVNVWLGFPYMMVLCAGLLKSIPADLYEASAVAGAGPWVNFTRITMPLVAKPLMPLLIAAFAFNFNNFVLVSLLTGGRPDQLDTTLPAGTTDILVSYTWRIAFQDSGQQIGLAAAISTIIFLVVAAITLVQMRAARVTDDGNRR